MECASGVVSSRPRRCPSKDSNRISSSGPRGMALTLISSLPIITVSPTAMPVHDRMRIPDPDELGSLSVTAVGAARGLPCVGGPGVVAGLSGLRNGVEDPSLLTRPHVIGAHMAGCGGIWSFADRGTDDDQVLVDDSR